MGGGAFETLLEWAMNNIVNGGLAFSCFAFDDNLIVYLRGMNFLFFFT